MKLLTALIATLFLANCTPCSAVPRLVSGNETYQNVRQLTTEIPWYQTLPQAQYEAQRQGKMIFWVHMLGNLSGAT